MEQIENFKIFKTDIHSRAKDLTGRIFGDYQILYRTECPKGKNPANAWWLCQCNLCKNYSIRQGSYLTKKSSVNECSCRYDLTGQKIGRWTVMYATDKRTKNRQILYHCKCECGNEKDVNADALRRGESKSCGCLQSELIKEKLAGKNKIDLTGQRFGKLIALYPIYNRDKDRNAHTKWHCRCDCGNECDIDLGNLRSGKSQSCGCTNSKQEENIIKLLTKYNIIFEYQKRFNNLKIKEFDFYINNKYIIEYDGSQHFYCKGSGWDTEEHFNRTRQSDLLKNRYCFENNIPIIRIPYDSNYTIDDLKLETTRFLLTPKNEEEYYKSRSKEKEFEAKNNSFNKKGEN
jgi:hypothetical protein